MEVHKSKCLSNVRIHVERVIGKMRNYLILQSTIPVNQVCLLDDIVVIIAALTNILPSVVPYSRFKSSLELMLCVIDISTLNKTYLDLDHNELFSINIY